VTPHALAAHVDQNLLYVAWPLATLGSSCQAGESPVLFRVILSLANSYRPILSGPVEQELSRGCRGAAKGLPRIARDNLPHPLSKDCRPPSERGAVSRAGSAALE
jgi:hypothetical protein